MSNRYYGKSNYFKLQDSESTPLFEVSKGKGCRLYPYLWSKECHELVANQKCNPFKCKAKGPVDPNQAYLNFPKSFEYTLPGHNCPQ